MARCWVGDVGVDVAGADVASVDVVGVDIPAPRTEGDTSPTRAARRAEAPEPAANEPVAGRRH